MKQFLFKKKYLFLRILVGFILGILLGVIFPNFSMNIEFIGDIYLNLLSLMIIPIIFVAVSTGIINIGTGNNLGRIGLKTVSVFIGMFIAASIVGLSVAYIVRPGLRTNIESPSYDGEIVTPSISDFFMNIIPENIFVALSEGDILATIIFTVILSLAIVTVGKKAEPVKDFINSLSHIIFKILDYVMELTPIGIISLMAYSVAEYGPGIFSALGLYILTAYVACIIMFILVMMLPVWLYTGLSPVKFIGGLYKIWLVALSTTSSAVTLPTNLKVSIEEFKTTRSITNFVLPLGTTINMAGGAISFSLLAVFVSDFYNLPLSFFQIIYLVVIATILNMAAPGIPGGGIVIGASFLTLLGLPIELMGPIAAIYRLLDIIYTTMNITGDTAANLLIDQSEKNRAFRFKEQTFKVEN